MTISELPATGEAILRDRLRSLADAPLLSAGEELAAAATVADGRAAENELAAAEGQHPVDLTLVESLVERIQRAEEARELLLRANRRLVVAIARRHQPAEASVDQLLAAGNRALARAVDRFDPRGDLPFGSFARWWIEHAMRAVHERTAPADRPGGLSDQDEALVLGALARLHEPDARLIELRLGLRSGQAMGPEQVSQVLGLSAEHVDQQEERALAKLRHPCTPGNLRHLRRLP